MTLYLYMRKLSISNLLVSYVVTHNSSHVLQNYVFWLHTFNQHTTPMMFDLEEWRGGGSEHLFLSKN